MNTTLHPADPKASLTACERRAEARREIRGLCDVWLIDHYGCTMLRCRGRDISANGMRLRVPPGYGVTAGQRYELSFNPAGEKSASDCGIPAKDRWITVVRVEIAYGADAHYLDVGVVFEAANAVKTISKTA